jgi:hypothetical protein
LTVIRKIGDKYHVLSESGKRLGSYDTAKQGKTRLAGSSSGRGRK